MNLKLKKRQIVILSLILLLTPGILTLTDHTKKDKPCVTNEDCSPPFLTCKVGTCKHKDLFPVQLSEILGAFFMISLTLLAAASGLGGGAIIVPSLLIFFHFDTKDAVALSNGIILVSGVIKFLIGVRRRHPTIEYKTLVDYNVVLSFIASLLFGVFLGSMLGASMPNFLQLLLLIGVITISFFKGINKSRNLIKKENEEMKKKKAEGSAAGSGQMLVRGAEDENNSLKKASVFPPLGEQHSNGIGNTENLDKETNGGAGLSIGVKNSSVFPMLGQHSNGIMNTKNLDKETNGGAGDDKEGSNGAQKGDRLTNGTKAFELQKSEQNEDQINKPKHLENKDSEIKSNQNPDSIMEKEADQQVRPIKRDNKSIEKIKKIEGSNFHPKKIFIILGILIISVTVVFLRGGKGLESVIGVKKCENLDWIIFASYGVLVLIFLILGDLVVLKEQKTKEQCAWEYHPDEKIFNKASILKFNLTGIVVGIISVILGIGGGMITNPVLMSQGFPPQVISFTGMYMIMVNKIVAAVIFLFAGMMLLQYLLSIGLVFGVGLVIVEWKIGQLIKKYGRQSIISVIFVFVLLVAWCFTVFSAVDVYKKGKKEGDLWEFKNPCE